MLDRQNQFFDFVVEREAIRLRKEADSSFWVDGKKQWTQDPILAQYKFTNVHRHHDRTSRELREQFYGPNFHDDRRTILMNAALYRYFGTHEFASCLGWTAYDDMDSDFWEWVKDLAEDRLANKERVFTGAYVITNQGISAPKQEVVVDYFLKALQKAIPKLMDITQRTMSWEFVADEMRKIQGFGGSGFMTKEILLDTTYTSFWDNVEEHSVDGTFSFPCDWWDWTPIGPGARRGAARVNGDDTAKPLKEDEASTVIWQLGENQQLFWPDDWDKLAPHDIQFQLCEFDKYERVRLGQGKPRSRYSAVAS